MPKDAPLQYVALPLTGRWRPCVPRCTLGEGDFSILTNMRYTDTGIKSVSGMTKINSNVINATYLKTRSAIHYKKDKPVETHVLVQAYNSAETASQVLENTTAIGNTGQFSATALWTDSSGAGIGKFSQAPDGCVAYTNGVDSCIWGGVEYRCAGFINFNPDDANIKYDYTDRITNDLQDTNNVAILKRFGGIDSHSIALLHFENASDIGLDSTTYSHSFTNTNVATNTTYYVFGSRSASFNGTTAYLSLADDEHFNFTGGTFTIETRVRADDVAAVRPLYFQYTSVISFTNGGKGGYETHQGDSINGITSSATANIVRITVDTGTWGGGNAAGHFYITSQSGTFVAEEWREGISAANGNFAGNSVVGDYAIFYINATGGLTFRIYDYDTSSNLVNFSTADNSIAINTWYHIELDESGDAFYIYIDGIQRAVTSSTSRMRNYSNSIYIGYDGTNYFDGLLDEYRICDNSQHSSGSAFTIPVVAYSLSTGINVYLGTTRPITGVKFYVLEASKNTQASTSAVNYWNGSVWTAVTSSTDGTVTSGVTLAKTGTISFLIGATTSTTVAAAKTKVLFKKMAYWYYFTFTGTDNNIGVYYVTVDAPFQQIVDLWDGVPRTTYKFLIYNATLAEYTDLTTNILAEEYNPDDYTSYADVGPWNILSFTSGGTYEMKVGDTVTGAVSGASAYVEKVIITSGTWAAGTAVGTLLISSQHGTFQAESLKIGLLTDIATISGDSSKSDNYVLMGFYDRLTAIEVILGSTNVNTNNAYCTIYYWSGAAWVNVGTLDDGTFQSNKTFNHSGVISWNAPSESSELQTSFSNSDQLYFYKLVFSSSLSPTVHVDSITGIPAQISVSGYKFPVMWQNRLFLCSEGSDKVNKVIYSARNTVCVWNGQDSGEIQIGDAPSLTAGTTLFTRYGGTIFDNLILTKNNETWLIDGNAPPNYFAYKISDTLGCVAPHTLISCSLGYEIAQGLSKHVAIWQAGAGIVMFDGNTITPIDVDINEIFTDGFKLWSNLSAEFSTTQIYSLSINKSTAFYDENRKEYHFLYCKSYATGEYLNDEFVYDLIRRKWFRMERSSLSSRNPLTYGITVTKTTGEKLNYGFLETGYMEYLEAVSTAFDGLSIIAVCQTGDAPLAGWMNKTSIRFIKPISYSGSGTVTLTHYGEGEYTGDTALTYSLTLSTHSYVSPIKPVGYGPHIFHGFRMVVTGVSLFRPVGLGLLYKVIGPEVYKVLPSAVTPR